MKYGYGLLGYNDDSFLDMDIKEFATIVNYKLLWKYDQKDEDFEQLAVWVAHLMTASGNMKKSVKFEELCEVMYKPYSTRIEEYEQQEYERANRKEINEQKVAILKSQFGIT